MDATNPLGLDEESGSYYRRIDDDTYMPTLHAQGAWQAHQAPSCLLFETTLHRNCPMILVGQYDSPVTRRVAIALHHYGMPFTRDTRSI